MKKYNHLFTAFLVLVLVFAVLPFEASANGPSPSPWYNIELTNLPEGTVYVDMLIYLPEDDPMYTELESGNLPDGFSENAEIITYCEGDYRSYSFHYRDAISVIEPKDYATVLFFTDNRYETVRYDHADDIVLRGDIQLAMLDGQGNILKVSPYFPHNSNNIFAVTSTTFQYDAANDKWEMDVYINPFLIFLYACISIIGIVVTCFVETNISYLFRLGKQYSTQVMVTNLISQIMMRIAFVKIYEMILWKYSYVVFVLELCVYVGEYLAYCWLMRDISWKRRLAFVLCANTISLILGNWLNYFILFN